MIFVLIVIAIGGWFLLNYNRKIEVEEVNLPQMYYIVPVSTPVEAAPHWWIENFHWIITVIITLIVFI